MDSLRTLPSSTLLQVSEEPAMLPSPAPVQAVHGLANLNSEWERRRKKRLEFVSFVLQFHRHITQTRPRRSSPTPSCSSEELLPGPGTPGRRG